jgi:CNT family concentrative nucleoside transporter
VTASILGVPATIAISKIVVPETGKPETSGMLALDLERQDRNLVAAVARGATEGGVLVINVIAMLVAVRRDARDGRRRARHAHSAATPLPRARFSGGCSRPRRSSWACRGPTVRQVGSLLGEKVVLTEFIAYVHLGGIVEGERIDLGARGR